MKNEKIELGKGYIQVYDFGDVKLHAYQTNDLMNDECFILENNSELLLIEFPAFHSNLGEFKEYIDKLGKKVLGKVFSDHPNGSASILNDVPNYSGLNYLEMTIGSLFAEN